MIDDRTPVLIAAAQASEAPDRPGYRALSPVDLAAVAARAAIADARATGDLCAAVDTVAAIRQFEISTPAAVAPFGCSNNPPLSIASRLGAKPRHTILEISGGQGPQRILGELAQAIAEGKSECALIAGSEAISTVLHLKARGEVADWSEEIAGDLDDRGYGLDGLLEPALHRHGLSSAIATYALFENARRARLGRSLLQYRCDIGALFSPFTRVALGNPHAAAPVERSAAELAAVTVRNRIVAEPYPRMTVARDQVNQAAALVVCAAGRARSLGVPEERWVHLHAVADANELPVLQRPDLASSPAARAAAEAALTLAGKAISDIDWLDLYSCFAIAVFNLTDGLGIAADDARGLTLTGGLPFFGGAGNNYSMHAIAEAVVRVRGAPGSFALVGANGGFMSKYSAGIYSTTPVSWADPAARRGRVAMAGNTVSVTQGSVSADRRARATVETYTLVPDGPARAGVVVARIEGGARIVARVADDDRETWATLGEGEPFGRDVEITAANGCHIFTFAAAQPDLGGAEIE